MGKASKIDEKRLPDGEILWSSHPPVDGKWDSPLIDHELPSVLKAAFVGVPLILGECENKQLEPVVIAEMSDGHTDAFRVGEHFFDGPSQGNFWDRALPEMIYEKGIVEFALVTEASAVFFESEREYDANKDVRPNEHPDARDVAYILYSDGKRIRRFGAIIGTFDDGSRGIGKWAMIDDTPFAEIDSESGMIPTVQAMATIRSINEIGGTSNAA